MEGDEPTSEQRKSRPNGIAATIVIAAVAAGIFYLNEQQLLTEQQAFCILVIALPVTMFVIVRNGQACD